MRCLTYARVSTEKQADKELSIPAQQNAMREYAQAHDWTVEEDFVEPGASGRNSERPVLQRLLSRCKQAPKIDVVLVHKIDRLARNVFDHATIRGLLKQRSIRLASVVENVDDTITGQLVENIMASIAEFYSANLGEEVKKGMRVMISRGEWPHLPPRGYLQTRTADGRPLAIPNDVEAPAIVDAFEKYATGRFSLAAIGEELHIAGISTSAGKRVPLSYVRTLLENPFYTGRIRWNGAEYPGKHKALISEELFLRVQRTLRHRFKHPGERGRLKFLMRGVARCGDCGYLMTAERRERWAYYRCIQNAHSRCASESSSVSQAHGSLLRLYKTFSLSEGLKQSIRAEVQRECERRASRVEEHNAAFRRRREQLVGKEMKLTEEFANGDLAVEILRPLVRKIRGEIATVDAEFEAHRTSAAEVISNVEQLLKAASSVVDIHMALDLPKQQRLLGLVFEQIVLSRGDIVDYTLRPPFDLLFGANKTNGNSPAGGVPTDPELPSSSPAIESLFGFDFSALEDLVSPIMSGDTESAVN